MNALVRVASAADTEALASLNAETQDLHVANRPDQFKQVDAEELTRWIQALLRNPSCKIWVAELDQAVVGYVAVLFRERAANTFSPPRKWWELDAVGVRAAYRRRGVCRALFETIAAEARAAGILDLQLQSWWFNENARHAFERLGFLPKTMIFESRLC